jgi:fructokinase
MPKVFSIGEALIDFIPNQKGIALKDVNGFEKAPGGAPANVAAAVSKLGGKSAFLGKLGEDSFGDFLIEVLNQVGVDTNYIKRTKEANTALAFVSLKQDGNRDFSFYRNPSADMLLKEDEIEEEWFSKGDVLHFCSVDLIEAPVKYAHIKAIDSIIKKGGIVSFDPNVRLPLWDNPEDCRKTILEFIPLAHILKISDEELEFITGIKDEKSALESLFKGNVKVVIFTRGSEGADIYTKNYEVRVSGTKVSAVDTTGAGDAFIGAVLYKLIDKNIRPEELTREDAEELLGFANGVGALTCMKKGAISALPTIKQVKEFLNI